MTLPVALRRWWPVFKRLHRLLTLISGYFSRAISPLLGDRGVPRAATTTAVETAAREPGSVTLHPGDAAQALQRTLTLGRPQDHPVFAAARSATIPATFTLEIERGRLIGDFAAAITPGGVLDHETSTYFGVTDWREHPLYLRPTIGPVDHIAGTAVSLTTRGTAVNYYHFLYDSIARLDVLERCLPDAPVDAFIVPHRTRYQRELLSLAGVDGNLVQPQRGRTIAADRLLVPSNPNWALDAPPDSVAWLRKRLRPSGGRPTKSRRLYLTRGDARQTRRYVQEAELMPHLEKRGFVRIDPGQLTVQEQIDTFHHAEMVVAPHGAGLTNVTFAPPSVRVLEMFPSTYVHLGLWAICQAIGAEYRYLVAEGNDGSKGPNAGIADDVSIPVARVLDAVDELLD